MNIITHVNQSIYGTWSKHRHLTVLFNYPDHWTFIINHKKNSKTKLKAFHLIDPDRFSFIYKDECFKMNMIEWASDLVFALFSVSTQINFKLAKWINKWINFGFWIFIFRKLFSIIFTFKNNYSIKVLIPINKNKL